MLGAGAILCAALTTACSSSSDDLADARRTLPIDATVIDDAAHPPDAAVDAAVDAADDAPRPPDAEPIVIDASLPIDADIAPDVFHGLFSGGSGTVGDPYILATTRDLVGATDSAYSAASFKVTADLDLSDSNFVPFEDFTGTFDGGGHRISHFSLSDDGSDSSCVGFFRSVEGMVSDVILVAPSITATGYSTAGLLIGCSAGLVIRDQVLGGQVTADYFAGGLVGSQSASNNGAPAGIASSSSSASVSASTAGGLVVSNAAVVIDSFATGEVSAPPNNGGGQGGGLVESNNGLVWRSYASGLVAGITPNPGGLISTNNNGAGLVGESFWDEDSSEQYTSPGGGIGLSAAQMTDPSNFTGWDFSTVWNVVDGSAPTLIPAGNVAPLTMPIAITAAGGTAQVIPLTAFDFNGDALTYAIVTAPSSGTAIINGSQITYTGDWNGDADSFTYQAIDVHGVTSPVTTITSTVTPGCNPAEPGFTDGGNGSSGNPYVLSTVAELQLVREYNYCDFSLANDIDLAGVAFTPLGPTTGFHGIFEGNSHEIRNLTYTSDVEEAIGLFASISSGTVENLSVVAVDLSNTSTTVASAVGGLAGDLGNATISNVNTSGTVLSAGGSAAGIAYYSTATLTNVSSSVDVTSSGDAGGLIGYQSQGSISHSFATGNVTGNASGEVGGLVGQVEFALIQESYATGNVSSVDGYAGGFVGFDRFAFTGTGIFDCYATGSSTASGQFGIAGGFMAQYGAVGPGAMSRTFATGLVTASGGARAGGFLGAAPVNNTTQVVFTDVFWDVGTSGLSTSGQNVGTGETDVAMQTQATYTGFDFTNVWNIGASGYPFLR